MLTSEVTVRGHVCCPLIHESFLPSFIRNGLTHQSFLEELSPNGQVIPFDIYTTFDQKDTRSYNCHRTNWYQGRDPFNQNSDRSDREKRTTSKGGPVFSKLFRLDRTDPSSFGPKFSEILVEWIAPQELPPICLLFLGKSPGGEVKNVTMGSWRHWWQ